MLLGIPFAAYALTILIVDPFDYLNATSDQNRKLKDDLAYHIEPHLLRITKFHNQPDHNIVLGDSRSNGLFARMNSEGWSNLAYGGSSLQEIIETFWWAVDEIKLDTVLIGINLNLYNKYNKKFWVQETLERRKNFFSYAFNRYSFQTTLLIFQSYLAGERVVKYHAPGSKEEFWKYTVNVMGAKFYEQFGYPDEYYRQLKEIADYCANNGIKLIFWIPPTHNDFQDRKSDYGLDQMNERFVTDLQSLAEVYNFDYPSELTSDKLDYRDPMHFDIRVGEIIVDEIRSGSPHYARFSKTQPGVKTGATPAF